MTRDMTRNAKCSAVKALVIGFESHRLRFLKPPKILVSPGVLCEKYVIKTQNIRPVRFERFCARNRTGLYYLVFSF